MLRRPLRLPLSALLSALLLVACGGRPEAMSPAADEVLGTQESPLCSGLTVSTLTVSGASTYLGELAASGSWTVSTGANAVRLEYFIDNVLYTSEERTGTSGTWYFSTTGVACGARVFLVKAYLMVIDSGGHRTTCWAAPQTASQVVSEACSGLQATPTVLGGNSHSLALKKKSDGTLDEHQPLVTGAGDGPQPPVGGRAPRKLPSAVAAAACPFAPGPGPVSAGRLLAQGVYQQVGGRMRQQPEEVGEEAGAREPVGPQTREVRMRPSPGG